MTSATAATRGGYDKVGNWVNQQFQLDAFGEALLRHLGTGRSPLGSFPADLRGRAAGPGRRRARGPGGAACGPPGLLSEEYDITQRQVHGNTPQAFVHALLLESAQRLATPWPAAYR